MTFRTVAASALSLAVLLCAGAAGAQGAASRVTWKAGYFRGNDFQRGAHTTHYEALQVGADVALGAPGTSRAGSAISATVALDYRDGQDADAVMFRVLLTEKRRLGQGPIYARFGTGWAIIDPRETGWRGTDGLVTQYALGYELGGRLGASASFVEFSLHDGPTNKLRGLSLDVGLRF